MATIKLVHILYAVVNIFICYSWSCAWSRPSIDRHQQYSSYNKQFLQHKNFTKKTTLSFIW